MRYRTFLLILAYFPSSLVDGRSNSQQTKPKFSDTDKSQNEDIFRKFKFQRIFSNLSGSLSDRDNEYFNSSDVPLQRSRRPGIISNGSLYGINNSHKRKIRQSSSVWGTGLVKEVERLAAVLSQELHFQFEDRTRFSSLSSNIRNMPFNLTNGWVFLLQSEMFDSKGKISQWKMTFSFFKLWSNISMPKLPAL